MQAFSLGLNHPLGNPSEETADNEQARLTRACLMKRLRATGRQPGARLACQEFFQSGFADAITVANLARFQLA